MCGILGFIGKSLNPRATYDLANALLVRTEIRGEHATGFWSCERGDGRIFFDKEPVKSSVYSNRDIWRRQFAAAESDLLIAHCRYTSINVGHEKYNKNNHPHASADKRVALVHNGKIPEYSALKSRYDLRSDCDSEILLGMFESGEEFKNKEDFLKQEFPNLTPDIAYRMMGLKEVFSRVNYGAMAVAIGERGADATSRFLWLFRDEERPLHVVDMRKTLGQIFFCSTAEIWRSAVESCPTVKPYTPSDQVIIEFPAYQVWMLGTELTEDPDGDSDNWCIKKFRITKTKFYDWKQEDEDGSRVSRPKGKSIAKIVSRLDTNEEVVVPKHNNSDTGEPTRSTESLVAQVVGPSQKECHAIVTAPADRKKKVISVPDFADTENNGDSSADDDYLARHAASSRDEALDELSETTIEPQEIDMESFDTMIKEIRDLVNNIDTNVKNLQTEGSLSPKDFTVIMDSLKDAQAELKGSIIFLKP